MKSRIKRGFSSKLNILPKEVKRQAKVTFNLWMENSRHPSLHFKKLQHITPPCFSIRVGKQWRALARKEGDMYYWFWIGSHAEYDKYIASLQ